MLDVIFREDDCRLKDRIAAENLGMLRRVVASLLRQDRSKGSVSGKLLAPPGTMSSASISLISYPANLRKPWGALHRAARAARQSGDRFVSEAVVLQPEDLQVPLHTRIGMVIALARQRLHVRLGKGNLSQDRPLRVLRLPLQSKRRGVPVVDYSPGKEVRPRVGERGHP